MVEVKAINKDFKVWMINNKSEMIRIYLDMYKDNFLEFCKNSYEDENARNKTTK